MHPVLRKAQASCSTDGAGGSYFVMGETVRQAGSGRLSDFGPIEAIAIAGPRYRRLSVPPRRDGQWNWRVLPAPQAFDAIPEAN